MEWLLPFAGAPPLHLVSWKSVAIFVDTETQNNKTNGN